MGDETRFGRVLQSGLGLDVAQNFIQEDGAFGWLVEVGQGVAEEKQFHGT